MSSPNPTGTSRFPHPLAILLRLGEVLGISNVTDCLRSRAAGLRMLVILLLLGMAPDLTGATLPQGFSEERVPGSAGENWAQATGIEFEDNGRMYVWEKGGRVWFQEYGESSWRLLIDLREEVGAWSDFGLLGFVLDPQFRANGHFYLMYVVDRHHLLRFGTPEYNPTANEYTSATIARITRYTARSGDGFSSVDYSSRRVLLGQSPTNGIPILYQSHEGGSLAFGNDGTLLVSTGDGASFISTDVGSAPETYFARALADGIITPKENVGAFRAQLVDSLSGKILRIDPATGEGVPSNPFYDPASPQAAKSKVWALGLRNPYRFTLRPGTGSHNPSEGRPGTLYIGDVGWSRWEELNVCDGPGLNFGWPWFEGVDAQPKYSLQTVPNLDAPNPLATESNCASFFSFGSLIRQRTTVVADHPPFAHPCVPTTRIPDTIPQFLHTPPTLDWIHGSTQVRTWIPNDVGVATAISINGAGSPVSGSPFDGNCSVAGAWYTGTSFPQQFRNTYFHADYGAKWIKSLTVDANGRPDAVRDFLSDGGSIVALAVHPIDGSLYYASMPNSIRRVTFSVGGNLPPVARAAVDHSFGPGPLTVQFTGADSTDPEGLPLNYEWDFGDGTAPSFEANPSHTFEAPTGVATRYAVTLRVTDSVDQKSSVTLTISVNNSPPSVAITQPLAGGKYPMTGDFLQSLSAAVADAESADDQLQYEWRVFLHHNNHEHQEWLDTNHLGSAILSPIGCDGVNIFYYRIELTVTDSAGLSTTTDVAIFPDCGAPDSPPVISAIPDQMVSRNQKVGPLRFAISDAEVAPPYLELSATSSNPSLVPHQNIVLGLGGAVRTVTVTPATGVSGSATITVSVNDGPNTTRTAFRVDVTEQEILPARAVWQIGTDNNPTVAPYKPTAEFSPENNRNDLRPGKVTRLPGDPEYVAATNPTADDDYYFAGTYAGGFNELQSALTVPADEPATAWERAHTLGDKTNRLHFILGATQVTSASAFRLEFELVSGGSILGGVLQPGFADHDLVVRFRNGSGVATDLLGRRVSQSSRLSIDFSAASVGATPGANSIEIVRTGPAAPGVSYFVQYDFLRLESQSTGNSGPVLAMPSSVRINEAELFSLTALGVDADLPAQTLTYSLLSGPPGLTVTSDGALSWIPTELQGPGNYEVRVQVTDSGSPPMSHSSQFSLSVGEVNTAPELATVLPQTVRRSTPLSVTLSATDADVPAQRLTYSLVSGPSGMTVSPGGVLAWTPTELQGTGHYPVEVRVTDDGVPTLSATRQFTVEVKEVEEAEARTVWQIGTDNNPAVSPYRPALEFSQENNRNDLRPGKVTRLPGDPEYNAAGNPTADDDFYFAGVYPAGFNGLMTPLSVPNDEPPGAWERAHTNGDRTNRFHFVLASDQVRETSWLRLNIELVNGGSLTAATGVVPGFADHDMVIRFRNASGVATELFAQRVSQTTNLVLQFSAAAVGALAGANSVEIVRNGPFTTGVSYWIQYDYLRLESHTSVNTAPSLEAPAELTVDERSPLVLTLRATDADVPAQRLTFSLVSGPVGMTLSPGGVLAWTPTGTQESGRYEVEVRVTDDGVPTLSATRQFTIQVNEVEEAEARTVWQIGTDNNPAVSPYRPALEFSQENNRNDLRPGKVTRMPGDPEYNAAGNPTADDDFYFAGVYPAGFNGLVTPLSVPNDEPPGAWERAHTNGDRTNRFHFVLASDQVRETSWLRLNIELVNGGSLTAATGVVPGFADHDMVVRFRNASGVATELFAQRVSQTTNLVLQFSAAAVGALAGANSVEIVRNGPFATGVSYWIQYDYLRLESFPVGLTSSGVLGLASNHGMNSIHAANPADLMPGSDAGIIGQGVISVSGQEYLILRYDQPESVSRGVRYKVEATSDLINWSETLVEVLEVELQGGFRTTTVRDVVAIGSTPMRFLRLRAISGGVEASGDREVPHAE